MTAGGERMDAVTRRGLVIGAPALLAGAAGAAAPGRATAPGDLVVGPGIHRVAADTTVTGDLIVAPGGSVEVAAGATLTVLGDVVATPRPIFTGLGEVDLTRGRAAAGRPEWWGAAADDPAVDCRPALTACLRAHLTTLLGPGDYHLGGTWTVDRPNRRIWGVGRAADARGTRLLLTGAEGTVLRVGSEAPPATIGGYLRGVDVRWLLLGRTAAAAADGEPAVGLAIRHVLDCVFEALRADEHAVGYSLRGAVRTYLRDCRAFRALPSAGPAPGRFVGFDLDGRAPPFQTGGNASVYLIDCNAALGNAPRLAGAVGARIAGACSDAFLVRFETTTVATGIVLDGAGAGRAGRFDQIDLHIETPVIDQAQVGIAVSDLGAEAMAEIVSPYVGLAAGGGAALSLTRVGGGVRVAGGQLVGALAAGAAGLALDTVSGATVSGTALLGFARPVVARRTRSASLDVTVLGRAPGADAAVALEACRHLTVAARLPGSAGPFAAGVAVDAASRHLSIETALIDPDALARPAAAVTVAGAPVAPTAGTTRVTIAP